MRRNCAWRLGVISFSLPELSKKSKQLLQPFSGLGFVTLSKCISQIFMKDQPSLSQAYKLSSK